MPQPFAAWVGKHDADPPEKTKITSVILIAGATPLMHRFNYPMLRCKKKRPHPIERMRPVEETLFMRPAPRTLCAVR
jgi:hypothetical protein